MCSNLGFFVRARKFWAVFMWRAYIDLGFFLRSREVWTVWYRLSIGVFVRAREGWTICRNCRQVVAYQLGMSYGSRVFWIPMTLNRIKSAAYETNIQQENLSYRAYLHWELHRGAGCKMFRVVALNIINIYCLSLPTICIAFPESFNCSTVYFFSFNVSGNLFPLAY